MKKTRKILTVMLTVALIILSVTAVTAAETKILYGNLTEPVLEVTNVIGIDEQFTKVADYGVLSESYLCQSPVTITTVIDEICFFPAVQMIPVGDELYRSSITFEPTGNIYQYNYDEASQSVYSTVVPYNPEFAEQDTFVKGASITISKPGIYSIGALFPAVYEGVGNVYLNIIGDAMPTESKVYVNGVETAFEAYNIADNNYFKIRDIAMAISGTEKQFDVTWDNENQVINLKSNTPYTVAGGELGKGEMTVKTAKATSSHMFKDGQPYGFTSYTIGGNNYFLLRDLGEVFDFGVIWDEATNSIKIDTTQSYVK